PFMKNKKLMWQIILITVAGLATIILSITSLIQSENDKKELRKDAQRSFYPLDGIELNYSVEIEWNSPQYKAYLNRLDSGINALLLVFKRDNNIIPHDFV